MIDRGDTLDWAEKLPSEARTYRVDFGRRARGEPIVDVSVRISRDDGVIELIDLNAEDSAALLTVTGGLPGRNYLFRVTASFPSYSVCECVAQLPVGGELEGLSVSDQFWGDRPPGWCPPDSDGFGQPYRWSSGAPRTPLMRQLPSLELATSSTVTQLGGTLIKYLANVRLTSGGAGAVTIGVPVAEWGLVEWSLTNRCGGTVTMFPNGGDLFEGSVASFQVNNFTTVRLSKSGSGLILVEG
jgi:hypothetical protein